jgi:hypothetical protein
MEKTVDFVMNLCPPPKHRRTIFTETLKVFAQLTEVLGNIPLNR